MVADELTAVPGDVQIDVGVQGIHGVHLGTVSRACGERPSPASWRGWFDQARPKVALDDQMECNPTVSPEWGESHIIPLPA
jgi:hypothetical protein